MPSLAFATSFITQWFDLRTHNVNWEPVAVFVGGSGGIGLQMAADLLKLTGGRAHIFIVGRTQTFANEIFERFPIHIQGEGGVEWKRRFVSCELSVMKNVREAARIIAEEAPHGRINFLMFSCGHVNLGWSREESVEGIDKMLAVRYYCRWRFTYELLPLLRKAREDGEDARVLSILGAGFSWPVNPDDFGQHHNYFGVRALLVTQPYNDYMMEEFALREPDIAFTHMYAGNVDSARPHYTHWIFKIPIVAALLPLWFNLAHRKTAHAAMYMWYALLAASQGFFRRGSTGDDLGSARYFESSNIRMALWEHSLQATGE